MKKNTFKILIFAFLFVSFYAKAQRNKEKGVAILARFNFGLALPAKDLALRYGTNSATGVSVELVGNQSNLIVGSDFSYFFTAFSNAFLKDVYAFKGASGARDTNSFFSDFIISSLPAISA